MPLTRKLSDLFVRGKEVKIDDGNGPVTIYMRKITSADAESAYRAAQEARAKSISAKTDPDSPFFQIIKDRCETATKDQMVDQLADIELGKKVPIIEAELEAEDEWANDDYLQGLYDAWQSLKATHFDEPTDESRRVLKELERFDEELQKRTEKELNGIKRDLASLSHTQIKDNFFDAQFERQGEIAWLTEYRLQQLYYAVRDPEDTAQKLFDSPDDIRMVETELVRILREEYESLEVEGLEGKD